ncbi:hypothetical protein LWI28_012948 [Acer negundo]|uniref:Non-specific lipid-transfer protein n=1 Tax=Acer negundo TaxID=4023 RepID=A0AAD5ITZ3_ACENE|nr:hypothetical protein LWI28_012948 [Acer negundo]
MKLLADHAVLAVTVVVAATAILMVESSEAITCSQVMSSISPCLSYVTGSEGSPSTSCCDNVRNLKDSNPLRADKQAVCQCIKDQVSERFQNNPGPIMKKASQIPGLCHVNISVPDNFNFDCKRSSGSSRDGGGVSSHGSVHDGAASRGGDILRSSGQVGGSLLGVSDRQKQQPITVLLHRG